MKSKIRDLTFVIFILSPLLSVPLIMYLIANRIKLGYILLSFFIGFVVFSYIPNLNSDLSRYYYYYEYVRQMNFDQFLIYLESKSDYGMHFLQFILSRYDLSFQIYLLIISIFTTSLIFKVFIDQFGDSRIPNELYLLFFLFFISIFGLSWILGVSRYYVAASIALYCYNFGILKNSFKCNLYIFGSIAFHFSFILIVFLYFLVKYVKINHRYVLIVFYLSFTFYFIPKESIQNLIKSNIGFIIDSDNSYDDKLNAYVLDDNDVLQSEAREAINFNGRFVIFFISTVPFLLIVYYSIFDKIVFDNFYYGLFTFVNFTNNFNSVSGRSFWIVSVIFSLYFIKDCLHKKEIPALRYIFIFYVIVVFNLTFLWSYKTELFEIFYNQSFLSSLTIFTKEITFQDLN